VNWVNLAGFGGNPYPVGTGVNTTMTGSKVEPIAEDFAGFVQGGLRSNGIVWTCAAVRLQVFSQARLMFQRMRQGRPTDLFGDRSLSLLERPWTGGTTGDLLGQMLLHADFGGNAYVVEDDRGELGLLRPDWTDIVLETRTVNGNPAGYRRFGYLYYPDGQRDRKPSPFAASEVAHFAPHPDPAASYRGMSWLTPVVREITSDRAATNHKQKFFENAATPNMVVKLSDKVSPAAFEEFVEKMDDGHKGVQNAYKTLYLGGGADATVVGSTFQQLDFKAVQGAGETRIAAASGVGAIIAQFSEGMQGSSLNAGNYGSARRRFSDISMRHAWQNVAGSLETIVPPPADARLWYDADGISFLQEDAKDAAEIWSIKAAAIRTLTDAGYTPESATAATNAMDPTLLVHVGLFSVQLQPPGTMSTPTEEPSDE
jgi:phage portal protein BeeE